jgi:hypothetical protein
MKERSQLYTLISVVIVAIIAIIIITSSVNKTKSDAAGAAVRSFEKGSCEYQDGYTTGCPCVDPSDGVLIPGAKLVNNYCK